jgi:nucleoside-diphosphate-sugar epimerase
MSNLVTVGTGFVCLNLAEAMLAAGADVVLFGQAPPPDALLQRLPKTAANLVVETGDIRDGARLRELLARHRVDRIVHGAAITASLDRERTQARAIVDVNLGGTIELLEAALDHGVSRVVQIGTGSVFGTHDPAGPPLDEERDVPVPESLYGISKYAAERTGLRYRETRGLDLCVARLGGVFGRYEYDTGVRDTLSPAFRLLQAAQEGRHVRMRRSLPDDWVYATDVAQALLRLFDLAQPRPLYHVARGQRWPVADWCERLRAAFPKFSHEVVGEDAEADVGVPAPRQRPPFAVEKLRTDTGFAAKFGPEEAFDDYMAWHGR